MPAKKTRNRPRQPERVLVVCRADGYLEIYARDHVEVHFVTIPVITSKKAAELIDDYVEISTPTKFRWLYWPDMKRAIWTIKRVTLMEEFKSLYDQFLLKAVESSFRKAKGI